MTKVYILPTTERTRPSKQLFTYPAHNTDYGVEQDFYAYLMNNPDLCTTDPEQADWHYLPVFWTRWHINHDYAKTGLIELQKEIDGAMIDPKKTFLICQYDDGPVADTGEAVQFLASRKSDQGIDIPLLSSLHRPPFFSLKKTLLASFIGRIATHPVRIALADILRNRKDVLLVDGNHGSRFFVRNTVRSHIALAPRGYGGSSFRFFEAMQLAVVPFLIGDIDTRPFKKFINWNDISLYAPDTSSLQSVLDSVKSEQLLSMGQQAKKIYQDSLAYQRWCPYVLQELASIKQ